MRRPLLIVCSVSARAWGVDLQQLADALNDSGFQWKVNPGDGAFYGPKACLRRLAIV